MRKLNLRHGLAFALILVGASCAQKKNPKNEPGLPGLWITTEERARYQAAQVGGDDLCVEFVIERNGKQIVEQTFALNIRDDGSQQFCNMNGKTTDQLSCMDVAQKVDFTTSKVELGGDRASCEATSKLTSSDEFQVHTLCANAKGEPLNETGTYFRIDEQGFLNYLKAAAHCRDLVE